MLPRVSLVVGTRAPATAGMFAVLIFAAVQSNLKVFKLKRLLSIKIQSYERSFMEVLLACG